MTVVGAATSFSSCSSGGGGSTGTSSRGGRFGAIYRDVVGLVESNACRGAHGFTQLVCHILEGGSERERGRGRKREREREGGKEGGRGRETCCIYM